LGIPYAIAFDSTGNLYIADPRTNRVRKVSNGVITNVVGPVGGGIKTGFNADNIPATSAWLSAPTGLAVDSAGNLYIADSGNNRVRKVSNGVITTVAGNGNAGFGGDDGPATSARLLGPAAIAIDSAGNLYISDTGNNRVRKVSNGVITTVAGNGTLLTPGFGGDNGPATNAQLNLNSHAAGVGPAGVAVDSAGNLYIADPGNGRIRKVSNGVITTVAGDTGDNGPAANASLSFPADVAIDSTGNLYIADAVGVRKVSNGVITTVAGNGTAGFSGDNGPATNAQLSSPSGITLDSAGNLYIGDYGNGRVRKVSNGVITTVAGSGRYDSSRGGIGDNGPATSAVLNSPTGLAFDAAGNLYIGDSYGDDRVRKVSNGVITTVAGGGTTFLDNGPATSTLLVGPTHVAVDSAGNLYISETGYIADSRYTGAVKGSRVTKVSNGVITPVAGNGTPGFSGDNGPATSAQLNPFGVAVDSAGDLYITDRTRIRKVSKGVITTVAGNGTPGFSGDNGPATSAQLYLPRGLALDSAGNLYVADTYNDAVRKIRTDGTIVTVVGGPQILGPARPVVALSIVSGNAQSGAAGSPLTAPLVVKAAGSNGAGWGEWW
jgi:sugar lactone lactonase YvrE